MSESARLRFALDHLRAADWEAFEALSNAFLAEDFPDLRTVAGVGDKGRDAVLQSNEHPNIAVQYSIVADWRSKIVATLERLTEAGIPCSGLIYVTNQEVGPRADALKAELIGKGVILDVRDRSYFVHRVELSAAKRAASRDLVGRVVDPLLPNEELARNSPIADHELRAGLVYLELQLHDSSEARNLTKLSYDALVLGTLVGTKPDNQRTRGQIVDAVQKHLPSHDVGRVRDSVNGSLKRLKSKHKVVLTGRSDSFALHHDERTRQAERAAETLGDRDRVGSEIDGLAVDASGDLEVRYPSDGSRAFVDAVDAVLQLVLERQGHRFAEAVRRAESTLRRSELLPAAEDIVSRRAQELRGLRLRQEELVELALEVVTRAFVLPTGAIQAYLRELGDAYTLLAFMQQAPDVQKAVGHFFSRGELVLDTTVLLPSFAETLLPTEDQRFTNLLRAAGSAGMNLYATEGVLNEIDTHLRRAMICYRTDPGAWEGDVPLVLDQWRTYGAHGDFAGFVDQFRGRGGIDDIELFLDTALGIARLDLSGRAEQAIPPNDRYAFTELWRPRKRLRPGRTESERDILLRHDVEMYLGVLGLRRKERRDVFGYEAWWVTADGSAHRMYTVAKTESIQLPSNPAMDPVFLSNLLATGPTRATIEERRRLQLPVALDIQQRGFGNRELSALADDIRAQHADDPEWLVRRRVRDAVNQLKATRKDLAPPELDDPVAAEA